MTTSRWLAAILATLAGWVAVLVIVMRFSDAASGALVLWPPRDFVGRLPPEVAVVGIGPRWMTVMSDRPGLAAALYAAGARIVLPAGLQGCVPEQ